MSRWSNGDVPCRVSVHLSSEFEGEEHPNFIETVMPEVCPTNDLVMKWGTGGIFLKYLLSKMVDLRGIVLAKCWQRGAAMESKRWCLVGLSGSCRWSYAGTCSFLRSDSSLDLFCLLLSSCVTPSKFGGEWFIPPYTGINLYIGSRYFEWREEK